MQVLLTFDINDKHDEVKDELFKLGYKETIKGDQGISNLPNTTVYIESEEEDFSSEDVINHILDITSSLNIHIVRAVAVEFEIWSGILGESFSRKDNENE
jgi:hypothetical protein